MQTEVVQLALDLLVREPDIEGFFGAFTKTMVEESESHACGVWLIDDDHQRCELWMAYLSDRLYTPTERRLGRRSALAAREHGGSPVRLHAGMEPDRRVPRRRSAPARAGSRLQPRRRACRSVVVAPLVLGGRNLGWIDGLQSASAELRRAGGASSLIEAIARQAALALHHSRLAELNRLEERRKAILEERNRLARDIHDNLAQGFAAILMQLQAAQREAGQPAGRRSRRASRRRSSSHART